MKSEGLPLSAQKAGRRFRRVKEETCRELESDPQRPRQRHPPWASICGGGRGREGEGRARRRNNGEGRRGESLPQIIKSGLPTIALTYVCYLEAGRS